jgi:translation initiation factor IF-2
MGHIDHGKSTLLDYIRKTNIVASEAGGITQHIAAYEVPHKDEHGELKKITFLDTPGHQAFSKMRARGAEAGDIAILVVSAEDSVKAQTIEAWETIQKAKLPVIVAINKIDKPNANIEKTKIDLAEKGIYLEGYGGDVPFAPISAKAGTGVDELLSLILLVAELQEFTGDPSVSAEGFVIESKLDPKRGISATLIIKNGTLRKGDYIVAERAMVGTRILESFLGKPITEATFSTPVQVVGFDQEPPVGSIFVSCSTKKEAENFCQTAKLAQAQNQSTNTESIDENAKIVPIVLKTDVAGSGEAIISEIKKVELPTLKWKITSTGVGAVSEADMKLAVADPSTIVIAFNVGQDTRARDIAEKNAITIHSFDIIYKLSDYLKEEAEIRRPRVTTVESTGQAKVLKIFAVSKGRQVAGGKVQSGALSQGAQVTIKRGDTELGKGELIEVQQNKEKVKSVEAGKEFGFALESDIEIAPGDTLESFTTIER